MIAPPFWCELVGNDAPKGFKSPCNARVALAGGKLVNLFSL